MGRKHTEESKKKMSLSRIGNKNALGHRHSQETKDKISRANTGKKYPGRTHSQEFRNKISLSWTDERREALRQRRINEPPEEHPCWKGGRTTNPEGYKKILLPEHPYADSTGRVMEHRLVAEKAIGKFLPKNRPVHHVNLDVADNRNVNLVICDSNKYHQFIQSRTRKMAYRLFTEFMNDWHYPPKEMPKTKKVWS